MAPNTEKYKMRDKTKPSTLVVQLKEEFGFKYQTNCDGEAILHCYNHGGAEFLAKHLDGVFAFCLFDTEKRKVFLGRDTFGVRPAFRLTTEDGFLAVCSEIKGLQNLIHNGTASTIEALAPGHTEEYLLDEDNKARLVDRKRFHFQAQPPVYKTIAEPLGNDPLANVRNLMTAAVKKRLMSQRRIGCLLSGGVDSSLVAALVVKSAREVGIDYPIQTFAAGMPGSTDIIAARKVAEYLGTEHHEVIFSEEEGLAALNDMVYHLESYDIITIRGAVGLYFVAKYIREKTDTVVVFSGEGADELCQGYIYFHNAPDVKEADRESRRLLQDLYLFDVLRGDRIISGFGLELRLPFLDHELTSYILSLDPNIRHIVDGIEKHLLRSAFNATGLLPHETLWRPKESFSDGVSSNVRSWHHILREFTDDKVTDADVMNASRKFPHNPPKSKEAFYFRRLFEDFFPGKADLIPYLWMPKWSGETTEPSARNLKAYRTT
ncbi:asparagine synthetase [glutamine-hydrolyzing]-like [Lingula anatina]|uniref:Glutamine-dependent asparagine synthetase n=1 Tax=Lingula anatina TaxID=7574 RepID=A0A1S3JCR0_LINAN|nr:asparagine synthetase [glutamine-hydrolyzing]-like [Lingula anatina]|eukprot:XP_013408108.2 asparagine synthetase [glutamine-hydrolyzing]-like [Lingula anatina]